MNLFDGDFDAEDAAILGGVLGFADESVQEEERSVEEVVDNNEEEVSVGEVSDVDMKLLYNDDPEFFTDIVKLARNHRKIWAKKKEEVKFAEEYAQMMQEINEEVEFWGDLDDEQTS